MVADQVEARLANQVLQALPRRLRRSLEAQRDRFAEALGDAISAAKTSGSDSQVPADTSLESFFGSAELAAEIATLIQTGQLDHDEWDSIFYEVSGADQADATSGAPAPTQFQATLERRLSEFEIYANRLQVAEPPSLVADVVAAENVVVGVQHNNFFRGEGQKRTETDLRVAYLNRLLGHLGTITLAGIDPKATSDEHSWLALNDIYVHLDVVAAENDEADAGFMLGSAIYFTALNRLSVILGEPGGGKSTLTNFFVLCMAGESIGSEAFNLSLMLPTEEEALVGSKPRRPVPQAWNHGALLPVRIVLRDFATFCYHESLEPSPELLWRFIDRDLSQAAINGYSEVMRSELLSAGGLVVFDGLDEVSEAESQRELIVRCIEEFSTTFSRCRVVVTSRTYAYRQQGWRLRGFAEATIRDLTHDRIEEFVTSWYREVAKRRGVMQQHYDGRATELNSAINANRNLFDLAKRPLLLTLMASLHAWRGGSLPEHREQLYADAVELLLDTWESQRIEKRPDGRSIQLQPSLLEWLQADRDGVRDLLNELAFNAHIGSTSQETADIAEERLITGLTRLSANPNARPLRLIEYLSQRAGIVVQRAPGVFAFPHRTFQEYLAACYLTDQDYPERLIKLYTSNPGHWREVALLALAKASRGTPYAGVFTAIEACPEVGADLLVEPTRNGAVLAGYALLEAGPGRVSARSEQLLHRVRSFLLEIMQMSEVGAVARIEAGRLLGKLGDTREEVTDVMSTRFCFVPAGAFRRLEEVRELADNNGEDFAIGQWYVRSARDVRLGYSFWISRFPVTAAHFWQFVKDGGFDDPELWPEAISAGQWDNGLFLQADVEEDEDGDEDRTPDRTFWRGPNESELSGRSPNRPATRVSWYEALAFCRWLTRQLPPTVSVVLPSESEWEKAARGGILVPDTPLVRPLHEVLEALEPDADIALVENELPERRFPWGDSQIDASRAFHNIAGPELGESQVDGLPVGMHPASISPYGTLDMLANIWQYTRSPMYMRFPLSVNTPSDDWSEELSDPQVLRAVKGCGSWMDSDSIRIPYRLAARANEAYVAGFRVVLVRTEE